MSKNLGGLEISKDLQKLNEDDLLVLYNFNSLHPNSEADKDSTRPAIETTYPLKKYMSNAVCNLFNSGKRDQINGSAFLTVKYHNPENLIFQKVPKKEKINSLSKKNTLEEIDRSRNGIYIDTLNSADIVDTVKCGEDISEVNEGFFCHNLQ